MMERKSIYTGSPEALHDIAHTNARQVGPKFVNPGTPEAALVTRSEISNATLSGATDKLRSRVIG